MSDELDDLEFARHLYWTPHAQLLNARHICCTHVVKAHIICLRVNQFVQALRQLVIDRRLHVTLKHALLHMFAIAFQQLHYLEQSPVLGNVIRDNDEHFAPQLTG